MNRKIIMFFAAVLFVSAGMAQKRTALIVSVMGYEQPTTYVDCVQSPLLGAQYRTNEGEEHLYAFDTDQLVALLVNGSTTVLMLPGDSLHVDVAYVGKNISDVRFSGTPSAVRHNQLYGNINTMRKKMKFRSQLLSAAVVGDKPSDRIRDSKKLLESAKSMIDAAGDSIHSDVVTYILAEAEADCNMSVMEYPVMFEEIRKEPLGQQGIGDYWTLMDGCVFRDDPVSLGMPEYIGMLMRYYIYIREKEAHLNGTSFKRSDRLEEAFKELAGYYDGATRDAVLFNLLANYIMNGKEIERVDPLIEEYKAKYNKNGKYVQMLKVLLQ